MRISYTWLKELVDVPYSPQELAEILTRQGMAVDALEKVGASFDNIVVGKLLEVQPHPNADALSVCRVDVGAETLQIVCGAPNIHAGQQVPVALIGARLGELAIKKSKLRGIESCGMCCAADELGISQDHSSLLFLDEGLTPGTPFEALVAGADYIFELDIPNNRPDLLNHIGVAREIAAHLAVVRGTLAHVHPPVVVLREVAEEVAHAVRVRIEDQHLCPRYTARVLRGVRIAASPLWLQARLHRLGIRPINNVVDATNLVLLEYGHPLHAFDLARVSGAEIIVRRAQDGELLRTLDDVERRLDTQMLVIADAARAVALAGVMGGANTEVTATTTDILLESAYFDGPCIRRTAKLLGLQSEASARFERGVRGAALEASARAAQLMCDHAGAAVLRGVVDVNYAPAPAAFPCRYSRCVTLLGLAVPARDARTVLDALGFTVAVDARDEDLWQVTPPTYRVDCAEAPDLAEDIVRVLGYDTVPTDSTATFHDAAMPAPIIRWREQVRDALVGAGLHEAMTPSLISPDTLTAAGVPADAPELNTVGLVNAMTQEQAVLRTLLYPGLIKVVQRNTAFGAPAVRMFELGRVYRPKPAGAGFEEEERLSIILWGAATEKGVWDSARELDFGDGVAVLDGLLATLDVQATRTVAARAGFHPGRTATVTLAGGPIIGFIGELEQRLLRALDLRGRVVIIELLAEPLCAVANPRRRFTPLPRFPLAERDIAFVVPDAITHQRVQEVIANASVTFVTAVTLFDVYRGEHVPAGHRSMAYRIGYRLPDRTLTDAEIDAAQQTMAAALTTQLGAQIRV